MIKNKTTFISISAPEAAMYITFLLPQYQPKTIIIRKRMQKYVRTVAVSVGERIAQKVTTIEWKSIILGKYSTISCVIDDNLLYSHFFNLSFSSSESYLYLTAGFLSLGAAFFFLAALFFLPLSYAAGSGSSTSSFISSYYSEDCSS